MIVEQMLKNAPNPLLHIADVSGSALFQGDCLEIMPLIPDKSVQLILADLPYGTTACKWDTVIPLEPLWEQYKRIIKDNGIIALFGSEPFSTKLRASNLKLYKYDWYWKKSKPNGWQHAKNKPMSTIETISIFSKAPMGHVSLLGDKRMKYNPQGVSRAGIKKITKVKHGRTMGARPNQVGKEYEAFTGFPTNLLEYPNLVGKTAIHPTQKPVALLEYLIKTYTQENDLVLDNCMGSGTTCLAAKELNRKFIGIEKEPKYYEIACRRCGF
jgi:site-specific DNA-methyltransferase (adenine-specific)